MNSVFEINALFSFTMGIGALLLGKFLTHHIRILRFLNIPESVSGGIVAALLINTLEASDIIRIKFDLAARDLFLLYFFTSLGLSSCAKNIRSGGKLLYIIFMTTLVLVVVQNLIGIYIAKFFGLPPLAGVLSGSLALIGGHGTMIAMTEFTSKTSSMPAALEIGTSCATAGLVMAGLAGGIIGRILIKRGPTARLQDHNNQAVVTEKKVASRQITCLGILISLIVINMSILVGYGIFHAVNLGHLSLPLFVFCFSAGFLMACIGLVFKSKKTLVQKLPFIRTVSDLSLGIFITMSLMGLRLDCLFELAGPMLLILAAQSAVAVACSVLVTYRIAGKSYETAVACVGFGSFSLGDSTTALANMSTVTQRYGEAHQAIAVIPIVASFLIVIPNIYIVRLMMLCA